MSIIADFERAFAGTSVYAILKRGEIVGRVIMQHREQMRVWLHFYGLEPVRGRWTRGYGFDKHTAGVELAVLELNTLVPAEVAYQGKRCREEWLAMLPELGTSGQTWTSVVEGHGYRAMQLL